MLGLISYALLSPNPACHLWFSGGGPKESQAQPLLAFLKGLPIWSYSLALPLSPHFVQSLTRDSPGNQSGPSFYVDPGCCV